MFKGARILAHSVNVHTTFVGESGTPDVRLTLVVWQVRQFTDETRCLRQLAESLLADAVDP